MGYVFSLEILLRSLRVHILNLEGNPVHAWESETFDIANHDESLALLLEIVPWLIKEHELPSDRILGAGVGITGRVNTRKGISHSFLHTGPPLCDRLTKAWKMPVFIDNDTHLLALGENTFGLAREMENVVCVNLSKGLAVSVIANGKLQSGHSGFAGEFGHLLAGVGKLRCVCGKTGCLETLVSGLALESAYLLATNKKLDYRKILTLPDSNSFSLSVELVKMGEQLGQSLAMLIDLLNPERIVLGGGFSPVLQRMYPAIHKGIHLHSLPQLSADCDLTISSLGERAAVLGAFALVTENLLVG